MHLESCLPQKRRRGAINQDWQRKKAVLEFSAGLMAITDGYAIGPKCLAWARRTWLEKERKATAKERAARLERILLKDKVELVLGKGATLAAGKWNNTDLKVMIQWFKRDGDKDMPKSKEGFILRYRETHTHVVDDTSTYPHEEVYVAVAHAASSVAVKTITHYATHTNATTAAAVAHTTARATRSAPTPTRSTRSAPAHTTVADPACTTAATQDGLNLKPFDLATDGYTAA
jgi:hypothetical protein